MTAQLSPPPRFRAVDSNGNPIAFGQLTTYAAGTTTPQATYVDSSQTTQNTNPITLNAMGECSLWLDPSLIYKYNLTDQFGNQVPGYPVDNIPGGFGTLTVSLIPNSTNTLTLGNSTHSWAQIYLGANAAPAYDSVSGNIGYYARTAAEIAASVTPTNYAYAPGVVERYGADPTGANDSTTAIVNAALSVGIGGAIVFQPNGLYKVTPNGNHTFFLQNKTNFVVQGNNATIRASNGAPCGASDEMMMVKNCQDFLIENLIIDGNLANRSPVITTDSNIDIRDSSARGIFRKVRSINACLDGWTIQTSTEGVQSSYPADITLEDCTGENSWRNNISAVATQRCKIIRGRYINAGTTASGTAPRDGIDIEPNTTTTFGNADLVIDGVEVSGNANFGLNVGGSVVQNARVRISGLIGSSNTNGFLSIVNCNDIQVVGLQIGTHPNTSRGIIDIGTGTPVDISLQNIQFAPQPSLSASQYLIYDQGNVTGRLMIDGVKAYNVTCHGISTNSDATVENIDIKTITQDAILVTGGVASYRNITVDGCSLRGFYASVPVEVDGLTLIDCASTTASGQFDTGSAGAIARNVLVKQRTSIPGGAVGLFFNVAPASVQNVLCISAGTNYTAANSINFSGGTTGTQTRGLSPNPFSASATIAPGVLANGASTNGTVAIAGATFGDKVTAGPGADSQGMTYSANVSSAGNIRWTISNTSGVGLTWASSTWNFSIEKG